MNKELHNEDVTITFLNTECEPVAGICQAVLFNPPE